MRIYQNISANFAWNRSVKNEHHMQKSIEKLATSLNISKAADSASGLAISEGLRAQIRGLSQAQRNMQDGMSMLKAVEEGLGKVNGLLQRARELAVMSANDTFTNTDRENAQLELNEILEAIDDSAKFMEFNTKKILGPEHDSDPMQWKLHIGSNPGQTYTFTLFDASTKNLGLNPASLTTQVDANQLIEEVTEAITKVTGEITKIGSVYEALEHHHINATYYETNLTLSESKIRDTDMAKEMLRFITTSVRSNADQMIMFQANNRPETVIHLLYR